MTDSISSSTSHSSSTLAEHGEALLDEIKIRARLRLNALQSGDEAIVGYAQRIGKRRRWPMPAEWKLQHALNLVATELGFRDYEHARVVFGGEAKSGSDMGAFWHSRRCDLILNHWFASYDEAKSWQKGGASLWLFPYGKQFVVSNHHYVDALSLDSTLDLWNEIGCDLAASYATPAWFRLAMLRLNVTRGAPPPAFNGAYR